MTDDIGLGQQQRVVLAELVDGPATPSTLAEGGQRSTGMAISHISKALSELRDVGCVELLVPEDQPRGRVYGITPKGVSVLERAKAVDGEG